jgi:hypothetical protein
VRRNLACISYQVGEKDSERYFADYWEVLAFLREMPAPAFRRPNTNNMAGIVRCDAGHAEDVSVGYLQRLPADLEHLGIHAASLSNTNPTGLRPWRLLPVPIPHSSCARSRARLTVCAALR